MKRKRHRDSPERQDTVRTVGSLLLSTTYTPSLSVVAAIIHVGRPRGATNDPTTNGSDHHKVVGRTLLIGTRFKPPLSLCTLRLLCHSHSSTIGALVSLLFDISSSSDLWHHFFAFQLHHHHDTSKRCRTFSLRYVRFALCFLRLCPFGSCRGKGWKDKQKVDWPATPQTSRECRLKIVRR